MRRRRKIAGTGGETLWHEQSGGAHHCRQLGPFLALTLHRYTAGRSERPRSASLPDLPLWIPCHLPHVSIRVLEVAGVATPECLMRRLYHHCAATLRLLHHVIDFRLGRDVMPDGELGRARASVRDPRIVSNALSGPEREFQSGLKFEERDGAMFELRADNAFGLQPKAVPVEPDRRLEIVDTDRDERDAEFHAHSSP